MMLSDQPKVVWNDWLLRKLNGKRCFIVPADGLASSDATTSAGIVMTNLGSSDTWKN